MIKNGKRLFAGFLIVLLLCGLTACGKKPVVASGDNLAWVFASDSAKVKGALSDQGYYFGTLDGFLSFGDFAMEKSIPLCTKVGCYHNGESCDAFISGISTMPMFFREDHLYYIQIDYYGTHLMRRNSIGTDLVTVADLGVKYVKEKKVVVVRYFVPVGNYLYYCAQVENSVPNEETGYTTTLREREYIARVDLNSGKEEILVDEITETLTEAMILCAAREDGVLFFHKSGVDKDMKDPSYADALSQMTVTLKCWSSEEKEVITLFQKTRDECSEIQMVADGKVYYTTMGIPASKIRGDIYSYDLNTGKEERIDENATFVYMGGGYVLRRENEIEGYWIYDLKKNETLPNALIELSSSAPQVDDMSDQGVVLQWLSTDETSGKRIRNFSYVTYESLSDGLQEEDLITLRKYQYQ